MSKGAWAASLGLQTQNIDLMQLADDNSAIVFFTISVPNVNTAAFVDLLVAGGYSDGDGLDVKRYTVSISRVAGVASVINIATAGIVGNNPSTGHTSMTATGSVATSVGGATAVNKLVIRAKVAAGSSAVSGAAVHPIFCSAELYCMLGQATLS